jgi:hypothetical protein
VPENIDLMKLLFWTDLGWRNKDLQRKAAFGSNHFFFENSCQIEFIKVYKPLFCAMAEKYRQSCLSSDKVLDAGAKAYRLRS